MDVFQIQGPVRLSGHIEVSGSKNAALPIMAASILAPGRSSLVGVPQLADIAVLKKLLESLGSRVQYSVFELYLTEKELDKMLTRVGRLIEKQEECILTPLGHPRTGTS